ncbi:MULTISPECIES: hypothetical protein [Haloferax]|uniref:DUF8074 domain-containing protein n=2 Tax=Haloferax gibbonsii TaxID=35746 RepID=A0A0K1IXY0_HALGI|nr:MULTISPECIES: hypothetical protein [Haloferax]AKU09168.1 hypothetical protein ABY42_15265 [Haloferax gibbonsii]ELZ85402.1 hypothetical protein C454_00745 [Haloferax gibbonsii ATCC 33959]QOS13746.1 uncharacterized protein HfgLR_22690 [Haloferax gibbonsii]REA02746.1 hypothetical protein DEQ92_13255 [Haloferax sp. Atlit-6N]
MNLRTADLTVFVFVLGVMLSGMWLAQQLGMEWSPTLFAIVAVVAAVWTAYYRFGVEPRIEASRGDDDDNRQEPGVSDGARE